MFFLSFNRMLMAASRTLVYGMLLATVPNMVYGQMPDGVIRTFAVSVNSLQQAPDFLGHETLGKVVAGVDSNQPVVIRFTDFNCDERLDSTVWEFQNALHVTREGADSLSNVMWLITPETPGPPPVGSVTFGGSNNPTVLSQELVYYEIVGGHYRVRCSSGGAGLLVVVTAVFSR